MFPPVFTLRFTELDVGGITQGVVSTIESNKVALEEDISINEEVGRGGLNTTKAV